MRVLIVEDDIAVSSFIKKGLDEKGFITEQVYDGKMALKLLNQNKYDILLFDNILPNMNGIELCKSVKETVNEHTPIIMLTALSTTEDIVEGLESGADDYITKPFKFKELVARIHAVTRRKESNKKSSIIKLGDLEIDHTAKSVKREGNKIQLTAKEYHLLYYLAMNKNKVVSRVDILENVWDVNFDFGTNIIDVYVSYLRNKIDKNYEEKFIQTVVGMGYMLKYQE